MSTRYENCLIGRDPQTCDIRAGCRYWNRVSRRCEYQATKAQERKRRHIEKFDSFDEAREAIRINKA